MINYPNFLLFFLLSSISAFAQDSKFAFGIESNVGFSDRIFVQKSAFFDTYEKQNYRLEENTGLTSAVGLSIEYHCSDKFTIQSGIRWMRQGYSSTHILNRLYYSIIGEFPNNNLFIKKEENDFIEFPIEFNYYLTNKGSDFYCTFGLSPNYNLKNTTILQSLGFDGTVFTEEFENQIDPSRTINVIVILGFGLRKSISKRLFTFIQPNIKMQTLTQSLDTYASSNNTFNRKIFSYGLSVGLKFK